MSCSNETTLRQRALRAGAWVFVGYGLNQAIRLGTNLVMTRLLVPEMFGVMAIATMVNVLLFMLSDIGLSQNIIQSRRGNDPAFLDTAWVIQIIRGFMLWLLAVLLSVALYYADRIGILPHNSAYASSELPPVLAVSCLAAFIQSFQSTKMATANRYFNQRRLVQIELIAQFAAVIVSIVIGVLSRSIWALVAGWLFATLTTTILSHTWLSGHQNRFRWERSAYRELVGFGKWVFVSSAVYVLAANGDRLMLGALVDARVLGLYAIAALLVGAIEGGLSRLFSAVSLPAFSEIARTDPQRLREVYYKLRVPSDLLLLFLAGLLFVTGQLVIDLLYDARYAEAGGIFQVLSLSLITARYTVAHQVYLAVGMPRYWAIINIVRFVSIYTVFPLLYYHGGMSAAIWGIALHALATLPFVYRFNGELGLNDPRRELMVLVALPIGFLCGSALNLLRG